MVEARGHIRISSCLHTLDSVLYNDSAVIHQNTSDDTYGYSYFHNAAETNIATEENAKNASILRAVQESLRILFLVES
jgi:hypothetical protein